MSMERRCLPRRSSVISANCNQDRLLSSLWTRVGAGSIDNNGLMTRLSSEAIDGTRMMVLGVVIAGREVCITRGSRRLCGALAAQVPQDKGACTWDEEAIARIVGEKMAKIEQLETGRRTFIGTDGGSLQQTVKLALPYPTKLCLESFVG